MTMGLLVFFAVFLIPLLLIFIWLFIVPVLKDDSDMKKESGDTA